MAGGERYWREVVRCRPVEWEGLTLYPVTMGDYEVFLWAKEALVVMQQSLPLKYVTMPYLEALYALDFDALRATGRSAGMMGRLAQLLALALHAPPEEAVRPMASVNEPGRLAALELRQGDRVVRVKPVRFGTLRELLCAQNDLEVPDESHNMELEEAARDLAARESGLEIDLESQLYAVAAALGKEPGELDGWAVRRFQQTVKAIDRRLRYQMYGVAELSGMVKFKEGNPCPSWCFDKKKGLNRALRPEEQVMDRLGGALQPN